MQILSVSELNNSIKELLENTREFADICVSGELSNYKIYPSGHHYFTLKDSESSLKCVMFKGSAMRLSFRPENGIGVNAFGRISVYPRDGVYQLYCSALIPSGAGDLQAAFEQLKSKLDAEGLFSREHKKTLPRFPQKIAIITSPAGAAVHDMIRILGQRWPMSKLLLLPVRVQGVEAPAEIAGAVRYANEFQVADVIITGRGGGSIEDLWAFNDERVARAIYDSDIPVISAVGHEPDVTISDYVADVRASTPSNAAELAVPDNREMREYLQSSDIIMSQGMRKKLAYLSQRLEAAAQKRVLNDPKAHIENRRITLDYTRERLAASANKIFSEKKQRAVGFAASLDALSPLRVLTRGYSIAEKQDGTRVNSCKELNRGEVISLRLTDGAAQCSVVETFPDK